MNKILGYSQNKDLLGTMGLLFFENYISNKIRLLLSAIRIKYYNSPDTKPN